MFGERGRLAKALERSLSTCLFFFFFFFLVVNHGIDIDKLSNLKSIAQSILELPEEVKLQHLAGL